MTQLVGPALWDNDALDVISPTLSTPEHRVIASSLHRSALDYLDDSATLNGHRLTDTMREKYYNRQSATEFFYPTAVEDNDDIPEPFSFRWIIQHLVPPDAAEGFR